MKLTAEGWKKYRSSGLCLKDEITKVTLMSSLFVLYKLDRLV